MTPEILLLLPCVAFFYCLRKKGLLHRMWNSVCASINAQNRTRAHCEFESILNRGVWQVFFFFSHLKPLLHRVKAALLSWQMSTLVDVLLFNLHTRQVHCLHVLCIKYLSAFALSIFLQRPLKRSGRKASWTHGDFISPLPAGLKPSGRLGDYYPATIWYYNKAAAVRH